MCMAHQEQGRVALVIVLSSFLPNVILNFLHDTLLEPSNVFSSGWAYWYQGYLVWSHKLSILQIQNTEYILGLN